MAEARYRGQKVVVVSPDYADNVKLADDWLPAQPGTDGALAMGHVQAFQPPLIPIGTIAFLAMAALLGAASGAVFAVVGRRAPGDKVGTVTAWSAPPADSAASCRRW